jgi:hydrogenase maturation protein HypF
VQGAVQGVGFRPFVYRLAVELGLGGCVLNSSSGLFIEVEGEAGALDRFLARLRWEMPPAARIDALEASRLDPAGYTAFEILPSEPGGDRSAAVVPDLASCAACLKEIFDPRDRRFRYGFTNCTHCGPRYTILRDIPYDRPNTTMGRFTMCGACKQEYQDPADRRFHAQPNACPRCGPRLELVWGGAWDRPPLSLPSDPIAGAAELLRRGGIVALKGIGGFQLLVDARDPDAVRLLRRRKQRAEKPFAVMFPSLASVREHCVLEPREESLLETAAAPIVLLRPHARPGIAAEVSMASPWVGAMLPYSPLHHLLAAACGFPVVATSGNLSEEPIATENAEALARLGSVADAFLWHDRPIARPCDDSVARVAGDRETILRRARGYAPLPFLMRTTGPKVLAVGTHLKNAVAVGFDRQIVLGPHVGDLETPESRQAFRKAIDDLCRLYSFAPEVVACDLHPDYFPTRWAEGLSLPLIRLQHHHAHLAACAAENDVEGAYLGVAWDGTGYGLDGTIWGGEFLVWDGDEFRRVAHFRPFGLPGGEKAIREGRRTAFSLLRDVFGDRVPPVDGLTEQERSLLGRLLDRGLNAPVTTSAGRLFDAVAAVAGVARESRFEGQAALLLEGALGGLVGEASYPAPLEDRDPIHLDWRPLVAALAEDALRRSPPGEMALRFHNALVEWILAVASRVGLERVVMSGGVFQNRYLAERAARKLAEEGFRPYAHRLVPPNDGGIALGQAVLAGRARPGLQGAR